MSKLQASGFGQIPPEGGLSRNDTTKKMELGTVLSDTYGNTYRYIKASEALYKGSLVTAVPKAAWPTAILVDGAVNAASATNKIHVDAYIADYTANFFSGYYISIAAAAGVGRAYKIKSHEAVDFSASTEGDVFLEDNLGESWTDDAALFLYNPYLIENADAATDLIVGVAISTIAASSYGFIQVGGHCPAVYVGGTTSAAVVINEPIVPPTTVATNQIAGAGQGVTGSTEVDIMEAAVSPVISLQAVGANTPGYVEAFIKGLV